MRELDAFGRYVCEPCGPDSEVHPVKFGARIPVVLSSSKLHRPFKNSSRGQDIHVDWCTIPGGQVNTLAHAFRALYGKSCRPGVVVGASLTLLLSVKASIQGARCIYIDFLITMKVDFKPLIGNDINYAMLFIQPCPYISS